MVPDSSLTLRRAIKQHRKLKLNLSGKYDVQLFMDMDSCGQRRDPIRFTKESVIYERSTGELITRAGIVRLQPQIAEKALYRGVLTSLSK